MHASSTYPPATAPPTRSGPVEKVFAAPPELEGPIHETLGRYELRHVLASGGMATLYLAVARGASSFEKLLALKRIHPHLAKRRAFVEMFLDEARIASLVQHPYVCSVLDFGHADGSYFLTMEYVRGEPLARVQRAFAGAKRGESRRRIPLLAARIVADACEGLHAAHEQRDLDGEPMHVVHRDVSPHNLLVGYDGIVRVVDFGVARARNRVHETETGLVKGKFAYMAPEQMSGGEVDRRADIWSLGVVLWETVSGQRLFKKETESETIMAVTRGEVPPLSTMQEVPPGLDRIVRKALARDRCDRYPSARAMSRDLNRWLARQKEPVDAGEMAEWMLGFFPEGPARVRALERYAARPDEPPPRVPPRTVSSPLPPTARRRPSRRARVAMGLGFALALAGGAAAWLATQDEPQDPKAPAAAPHDAR